MTAFYACPHCGAPMFVAYQGAPLAAPDAGAAGMLSGRSGEEVYRCEGAGHIATLQILGEE